jgi:hypothetical protein
VWAPHFRFEAYFANVVVSSHLLDRLRGHHKYCEVEAGAFTDVIVTSW